jgi:hypothetical protein
LGDILGASIDLGKIQAASKKAEKDADEKPAAKKASAKKAKESEEA